MIKRIHRTLAFAGFLGSFCLLTLALVWQIIYAAHAESELQLSTSAVRTLDSIQLKLFFPFSFWLTRDLLGIDTFVLLTGSISILLFFAFRVRRGKILTAFLETVLVFGITAYSFTFGILEFDPVEAGVHVFNSPDIPLRFVTNEIACLASVALVVFDVYFLVRI